MSFRAIPKPRSVTEEDANVQGVSIQLIPIYGVTIPVIIRHGRLEAQVAMSQPSVVQGSNGPELLMQLARQGDSSTYGELRVTRQGSGDPILLVRGIAIYAEVGEREVRIPLSPEQAAALKGPLNFEYRDMPEAGGGVIAAVQTTLQ